MSDTYTCSDTQDVYTPDPGETAGPGPVTPQKVRAVLRKAGLTAAKRHSTRIRGWYDWSPGYRIRPPYSPQIRVEYYFGGNWSLMEATQSEELARIAAALAAAGLACEVRDGAVWVGVEAAIRASQSEEQP